MSLKQVVEDREYWSSENRTNFIVSELEVVCATVLAIGYWIPAPYPEIRLSPVKRGEGPPKSCKHSANFTDPPSSLPVFKMPSHIHDTVAAEKKRLRDRVAQQNLRNKRNRHIQILEEQVKICKEKHGLQDHEQLLQTIKELRQENAMLRQRQESLQALFRSCQDILGPTISPMDVDGAQASMSPDKLVPEKDEFADIVQQSTPPEHCQISDTPSAGPQQIPSEQFFASTDALNGVSHLASVQNGNFDTNHGDDASFTLPRTGTVIDESDDSAKANGSSSHATSVPLDFPMPDSSITTEPEEISKDLTLSPSSTAHLFQTRFESDRSDFLGEVDQSMSFDTGLWSALDLWVEHSIPDLPDWARIPLRTTTPNDKTYMPWDSDIRVIYDAPDIPSPLDLLFGSKENPLASWIQRCVKNWYFGDAERLAIGWLVYHYIKWRTQPTAERYARLPDWIKPGTEQTSSPHPGCLDMVLWKKLRLNILKNYGKYDIDQFIRIYCGSLKLKWSANEAVLVQDTENKYVVRPDFFRRFMSEDGWSLRGDFVSKYPELLVGLDLHKVTYHTL